MQAAVEHSGVHVEAVRAPYSAPEPIASRHAARDDETIGPAPAAPRLAMAPNDPQKCVPCLPPAPSDVTEKLHACKSNLTASRSPEPWPNRYGAGMLIESSALGDDRLSVSADSDEWHISTYPAAGKMPRPDTM